jgi:hypothetical protein
MADQQSGDEQPAAGLPEPGHPDPDSGPNPDDRTRRDDRADSSTVDAPARWSGSATVPQPGPRKSRWARRRSRLRPAESASTGPAASPAEFSAAAAGPDDWAVAPAVDPWADYDTPWDGFPLVSDSAHTALPPTRIDPPASTAPQMPPTRVDPPPVGGPPISLPFAGPPIPPPPAGSPIAPPPAGSPIAPLPAGSPIAPLPVGKTAKAAKPGRKSKPPVNRVPVQPRVPAGPAGRSLPAPPPWAPRPVQRPLPPAPRRKRRWGRRLAALSLLGVFCCCGLPFAYYQFPAARQYPVAAALPSTFADLRLSDDGSSKQAAQRLADQLRDVNVSADDVFAGVYADRRGTRVTVFGVTGWRFTPGSDVAAQLDRLNKDFDLTGVRSFDIGEAGAHEQCGSGRVDGTTVVVCAWADHGSLATVLLTRRTVNDSADLVSRLRSEVLTPG